MREPDTLAMVSPPLKMDQQCLHIVITMAQQCVHVPTLSRRRPSQDLDSFSAMSPKCLNGGPENAPYSVCIVSSLYFYIVSTMSTQEFHREQTRHRLDTL